MPASALIAPDNRLLGWSLTDLTLYGTQPVPGMVVGRADGTIATPDERSEAVPAPSDPAALAPAFHDIAGGQTALLDGGAHDGVASPGVSVPTLHHPSPVAEVAPSVPQPIGSGSFVQPPVATALPVVEAHDMGAHTPAASPSPAAVLDGTQAVAAVAPVLDAAHDLLAASALAPAAGLTAPLGDLATQGLATVAPVTDLLGHTLDGVAPAADLLGHTLDTVAPATGLVGTTLDAAAAPVAAVVGTTFQSTLGAVDHALAAVDHGPADSFGGSDPAAGIATLVGMVDSADAFDIGHQTASTAAQPVGSILDALAHDAMPAPLLGDDAHHDGIVHPVDDHGLHLGLLDPPRMSEILTPAGIQEAQARAEADAARLVALDSAARSAELAHGDEFASALRQCKRLIWTAAAFSGGVNLLFLASPIYLTEVYNRVIPSGSLGTLVSLTIGLTLALGLMAVFDTVRARILIRAAARLDRILAHRVFHAIIESAPRNGAVSRNAQMLRDLDQFRQVLAGAGAQFFFDVPWSPLFIIVLFIIQPMLGLVALGGAAVLLILAVINNRTTRESSEVAAAAANRSYRFTDAVARYAGPVRAMGMEDALAVHWHVDRDTMMRRQAEGSDRQAASSAAFKFVRLLLQSLMIGIGALLVVDGKMLPASIFAANVLLGRSLAPLELAVTGWRAITQAVQAGRRVQTSLLRAPSRPARTKLPTTDVGIRMEGVTFVPPGAKRPALAKVSLRIEPGEAVGIVGPSGAGKSCLARLLVAVTAPTDGLVTIGGVEGKHWTPEDLSRSVGYLPQTVGLFPGTIRENIARFTKAPDAEVVQAAQRANVHDMILELPDGYETQVDEGGSALSGGQRQRIGLARAMFGSPRLLVLDEPNAHLDADGEEALAHALATLKAEGCTIVLIAHRLNPIAHVDRVIVLSHGELQLDGPRARVFRKVKTELVRSIAREPVEGHAR